MNDFAKCWEEFQAAATEVGMHGNMLSLFVVCLQQHMEPSNYNILTSKIFSQSTSKRLAIWREFLGDLEAILHDAAVPADVSAMLEMSTIYGKEEYIFSAMKKYKRDASDRSFVKKMGRLTEQAQEALGEDINRMEANVTRLEEKLGCAVSKRA